MKVSIVMTTINEDVAYLSQSINAALNQEKYEIELIVSTVEDDFSVQFCKDNFPEVKVVTMPRAEHPISSGGKCPTGSFLQLNNGLKHITGDWFKFFSGNDVLYPDNVRLEIDKCLKEKTEVCYSAYDYIDENGKITGLQSFHKYDYEKHFEGNFISDCSIISRRLVDKYLPFDIALRNYGYWNLWLTIYEAEGNVFSYNPIPAWQYRQDSKSMHVNRFKDKKAMAASIVERNEMLKKHQ